jgi:hypothetical protein
MAYLKASADNGDAFYICIVTDNTPGLSCKFHQLLRL